MTEYRRTMAKAARDTDPSNLAKQILRLERNLKNSTVKRDKRKPKGRKEHLRIRKMQIRRSVFIGAINAGWAGCDHRYHSR